MENEKIEVLKEDEIFGITEDENPEVIEKEEKDGEENVSDKNE